MVGGRRSSGPARQYPQRQYPAVAIGADTGALQQVCTACGLPWLPWPVPPGAGHDAAALAEPPGPDPGYEELLAARLAPGGALLLVDDGATGLGGALAEAVLPWARKHGHPVHRLAFAHPEAVGPVLADLLADLLAARRSGLRLAEVEQWVRLRADASGAALVRWQTLWSAPASAGVAGPRPGGGVLPEQASGGVLPEQAGDEVDLGWGDRPSADRDDDWYLRERPPHHQ